MLPVCRHAAGHRVRRKIEPGLAAKKCRFGDYPPLILQGGAIASPPRCSTGSVPSFVGEVLYSLDWESFEGEILYSFNISGAVVLGRLPSHEITVTET